MAELILCCVVGLGSAPRDARWKSNSYISVVADSPSRVFVCAALPAILLRTGSWYGWETQTVWGLKPYCEWAKYIMFIESLIFSDLKSGISKWRWGMVSMCVTNLSRCSAPQGFCCPCCRSGDFSSQWSSCQGGISYKKMMACGFSCSYTLLLVVPFLHAAFNPSIALRLCAKHLSWSLPVN